MLNLKLPRRRFAALAALLGIASIIVFSLGACSKQVKEPQQLNLVPYRKGKKWGFSDVNKKLVIQPKYESTEPFSDGLARVQLTPYRFGFVDTKGNEVIPFKYFQRDTEPFSEGLADVQLNNKWGYIDKSGRVVIPLKWSEAFPFSEGLAEVC